ncbi:MAG: hypothetical protein AAF225_04510 [Pseudomonadota bacterium]
MLNNKEAALLWVAFWAVLSACSQQTVETPNTTIKLSKAITDHPLAVQTESAYVTDQSLWGTVAYDHSNTSVIGDPSEGEKIATLIEDYNRHWLLRENDSLAQLFTDDALRFRDGALADTPAAIAAALSNESRGERPEGFPTSLHLSLRDMTIDISDRSAIASYRVDILGGARWEFADIGTLSQVFALVDGNWRIAAHIETVELSDPNAPPLRETTPTRAAPFRFDFVYPAKDLDRAINFYTPILGPPAYRSSTRASFLLDDMFFELETEPLDRRATGQPGTGNGYAIIDVASVAALEEELSLLGDWPKKSTDCFQGLCLATEDTAGNFLVWRERITTENDVVVGPTLTTDVPQPSTTPLAQQALGVMKAWMSADTEQIADHLAPSCVWMDDALSIGFGVEAISNDLHTRWGQLNRGIDGLDGDLVLSDIKQHTVDGKTLIYFSARLDMRGTVHQNRDFFVLQVWENIGGVPQLTLNTFVRQPKQSDVPAGSLDYTGYPVNTLGYAGRYYKDLLSTEPYRDDNWFGFWSTTSVFGLVGGEQGERPFVPITGQSNGYADFSVRSAEEVLAYLKSTGAEMPLVAGINDQAGLDPQPGYIQVLAVDSEGNLVNFSEYLEY